MDSRPAQDDPLDVQPMDSDDAWVRLVPLVPLLFLCVLSVHSVVFDASFGRGACLVLRPLAVTQGDDPDDDDSYGVATPSDDSDADAHEGRHPTSGGAQLDEQVRCDGGHMRAEGISTRSFRVFPTA